MSAFATFLVLLSAVLHVTWNSLAKTSGSPVVFMGVKGGFLLLLACLLLPWMPLQGVPSAAWPFIVGSGLVHALYAVSLARAYELGDISFVYPIARSAPAFVPGFAWFLLGERLTVLGVVGTVLVVGAISLLQLREGAQSLRDIGRSLSRPDGRWALVTLGCVVAFSLLDKAGMGAMSTSSGIAPATRGLVYFLLENSIAYTIYLIVLGLQRLPVLRATFRRQWRSGLVAALMTMVSYSLILHVMQSQPLSYIVVVRQSGVVLAVLYGWLFLREPQGPLRLGLSGVIACGVALVVASG